MNHQYGSGNLKDLERVCLQPVLIIFTRGAFNFDHDCIYSQFSHILSAEDWGLGLKVSYSHQGCIYLIQNTVKKSYFEMSLKCNLFL